MMNTTLNTHDIRLRNNGELFSAGCSCGWSSPDDLVLSAAAHQAVAHSTICVGNATMGAVSPLQ